MKVDVFMLMLLSCSAGSYCAFQDMRKNIIPNKILAHCAVVAVMLQAATGAYLTLWLLVMFLADTAAVLMYFSGMWAAGDAKLFMFMYLCVPSGLLGGAPLRYAVVPYIYLSSCVRMGSC